MKFIAQGQDRQDAHASTTLIDIPASYKDEAEEYREQLLEAASHADDELLELILEGKPVSEELLRKALRNGTLEAS